MSQEKAFIFSAPSGSGKTTIVKHLLQANDDLEFSISACTRDRRGRNEVDGRDYYFLSTEEFKSKIDNDQFIEWEEVYPGNFYGTLKSEIDRIWAKGHHVIFDVDVKGGLNLKKYFGARALAVFVKVSSLDIIKKRLVSRGTESETSLAERLYKIQFEMEFEDQFDVTLLNDTLDTSFSKAQQLFDTFAVQS